jgi:hypothetical protein
MRITEKHVEIIIANAKNTAKNDSNKDFFTRQPFTVVKKGLFRWGVVMTGENIFYYSGFGKVSTDKICSMLNISYHWGITDALGAISEFGAKKIDTKK